MIILSEKYTIALYIRLSIEDSKTESLSIHNQRLSLRKHAETLLDTNDYEILEFVDNGYSGTNFERPSVQELLELVRTFKINCIIVKDFSRFGRNSLEVGYFIEQVFPLFKVRFISINDNFDTVGHNGDTGGMEFAFKNLINEYYSIDLSRKSKTAKYAKMKAGEYQSKICRFGYKKGKNNRLEIDGEAAEVVRFIFKMVLEGNSIPQIAQVLYEKNIPTPGEYKTQKGNKGYDISRSGGIWSLSTITRMITDERYIGTYIMRKTVLNEVGGHRYTMRDEKDWIKIPDHHPAIISKEDFEKAQKMRKTIKCEKKKIHLYPLKSKVICGCCNHTMNRIRQKNTAFICKHSSADKTALCYGLEISESELHNLLFDIISKQINILLNKDNVNVTENYNENIQKKINCENSIQECYKNKRRLYEQLLLEEINLETYNKLKSEYDDKINNFKNILSDITLQTELICKEKENETTLVNISNAVLNENGFSQALSDLLIDKVFICPDKKVKIAWKVRGFI